METQICNRKKEEKCLEKSIDFLSWENLEHDRGFQLLGSAGRLFETKKNLIFSEIPNE